MDILRFLWGEEDIESLLEEARREEESPAGQGKTGVIYFKEMEEEQNV